MTLEEELIKYFWKKFNSCYPVTYIEESNSIFFFYNESYIRKLKLYKLNKQKIIPQSKVTGNCLFKINKDINVLQCDYSKIVENFIIKHSICDTDIRIYLDREIRKIDYLFNYVVKFSYIDYFNPFIKTSQKFIIYDRTRIKELVNK